MSSTIEQILLERAQIDFERHFGPSEKIKAYLGELGTERVVIIENHNRKAFYSFDVELLKIINLTEV